MTKNTMKCISMQYDKYYIAMITLKLISNVE